MKPRFTLAASALLAVFALSGCSEQPFGPEDMGGNAAPPSAVTAAAAAAGAQAIAAEVRLRADLTATAADPRASGHSDFRAETTGQRTFSTEVEDVSTDGVGRVLVTRGGQSVLDQPITIAGGFGDLNLDTNNGDAVPALRARDRVQVFDAAGALILRGTLRRD